MEKVSLIEALDVDKAVRESVELIGGLQLAPDKTVVIKPNVCNAKNPEGIVLTDFRVIKAVVNIVRENGNDLVIVESDNISGARTGDR